MKDCLTLNVLDVEKQKFIYSQTVYVPYLTYLKDFFTIYALDENKFAFIDIKDLFKDDLDRKRYSKKVVQEYIKNLIKYAKALYNNDQRELKDPNYGILVGYQIDDYMSWAYRIDPNKFKGFVIYLCKTLSLDIKNIYKDYKNAKRNKEFILTTKHFPEKLLETYYYIIKDKNEIKRSLRDIFLRYIKSK